MLLLWPLHLAPPVPALGPRDLAHCPCLVGWRKPLLPGLLLLLQKVSEPYHVPLHAA